jgi:hypothetical protein
VKLEQASRNIEHSVETSADKQDQDRINAIFSNRTEFPIETVGLGRAGHLLQSFASHSLSDLGQGAPLRFREPESARQVGSQDAVLSGQVLILQQQLLIDQARHKSQKASSTMSYATASPNITPEYSSREVFPTQK